jgi:hypothetical protein
VNRATRVQFPNCAGHSLWLIMKSFLRSFALYLCSVQMLSFLCESEGN